MRVIAVAGTTLLAAFLGSACNSRLPESARGQPVRPECPPPSADDFFFPPGAVSAREELDRNERDAYSRSLRATGAGSLSCGQTPLEAYRLLARYSSRGEFVIAVSRDASAWRLEGIELKSPIAGPMWTMVQRVYRSVRDEDVKDLQAALESGHFWTVSRWSEFADGNSWAIEARVGSEYKIVNRPNGDPSFRQAVRLFFALAQLPVPGGLFSS